ncbi:protein kinase [bacterium]|nr:protein kinase [bacterium]
MSIEAFLKGIAAFQSLSDADAKRLSTQCQPMRFPPGARIIKRGDPGDAMYVIKAGEVRIPVLDEQGREKFVARLGPNEFFGEMALLTNEPRAADVLAEGTVECLAITKAPLQEFLKAHPKVAGFLTEILGKRLLTNEGIRHVGKYKLIGELGRGGMAIVYEGLHPTLSRTVAIKMLSHELVYDVDFSTRFKNEAKIIAGLHHENIVQVFDSEEAYATYFIIMEKVEGTVLSRLIDTQGIMPFEQSRSYLRQLASALDFAHARGIVHRDIKPSNVIIEPDGKVKLMDFGIAKTARDPEQEQDIIGTAEYMSPEQALGRKMDGRADLYSTGVMAFEMLTGRLPFDSTDPYEILRRHIREPIPAPKSINPDVPEDLNQLVIRSTQKDPAQRFANGKQIVELLSTASGVTARFDFERAKVRAVTLVYDPAQEQKVAAMIAALAEGAKKVPGVRVFPGN